MRFRKILSLALALCLLMTVLPLHTFAAAEKQTDKQALLYANLKDSAHYPKITIQEVEPDTAEAPEDSDALWEGTKTYAPTYLSVDKAALKLRDYMKARQTSFELNIKTTDYYQHEDVVDALLKKATAHTGKSTEGDYLLWHLNQWGGNVETEWDGDITHYFRFKVELSYYTTAAQEKELTTAVNALLKTLNVKNKSDYEKVKAVYDYICNNVTYDYEHLPTPDYELMYTAYAALVHKTAVCQGYATLLYRLLLELGVDCRVITGLAITGEPHAWNIVKLGKVYYNMDATWDAELDPDQFFLRNSAMNATHYRYLDYMTTQFHRDYPMSATDYAEGIAGEPEYVIVSGNCGENAYWTLDRDGKLTIGGTGSTYDYYNPTAHRYEAETPWSYWFNDFGTVVVEEGITRLGNALFDGTQKVYPITNVTLPESLEEIGYYVFRQCDALTQIRIPDGVKYIDNSAFYHCDNLQTVTFGNALEQIGPWAFYMCGALEDFDFPESLKVIGASAFSYCVKLTRISIPDSVTEIECDAFDECAQVRSVTLGDSLQSIGSSAFGKCMELQEIVLPESVIILQQDAFRYCVTLKEITIPANIDVANGFNGCSGLQSAHIYSVEVGRDAFKYCTSLKTVVLSDNLTSIESAAFWSCVSLQEFTIPKNVTYLGDAVFYDTPALPAIYFQGDAPEFSKRTFEGATKICYYPAGNETWTSDVMQNYAGSITWVPYCPEHNYVAVQTPAACDTPGYTTYTCSNCGRGYVADVTEPQGHQWSEGSCDKPRTCALCGKSTGHNGHIYDDGVDGTCNICGIHRETTENRTVMHMFRMYDPNSGEHFYTGSEEERENLVAAGWHYEGVGFTFSMTTGAPVYRLFDPIHGEHLYTMDEVEKASLIAQGWNLEGVAFNSAYDTEVPQYRLHNPNAKRGAYHFTASAEERDMLIAAGWEYQGIGFYSSWK